MNRLALTALVLILAAGTALAVRPWSEPPPAPAPARMETAPATAHEPGFQPPPPAAEIEMAAFETRPPFSAARRPPPSAPPEPPPDPGIPGLLFGRWEVMGVLETGTEAIALVRDGRSGDMLRLGVGDRLGDAELTSIQLDALIFRTGESTVTARVNVGEQQQ